ncbi:MAG TPA: BON domain-containing protein [Opitutaceae bacterium]|nr:BON domain-containing protein [Opitutaceae bacterium]
MKALILLIIGGILGAIALHYYDQREAEQSIAAPTQPANASPAAETSQSNDPSLADKARDTADNVKDRIHDKLIEWHLTPDDIKDDLAKTGQVVRTKAQAVGEKIADGRIVTVIKAKYVLDRDLTAGDISVESHDGKVDLSGTVASPQLIGKAIALALDTDGVSGVTAKLSVAAK